MNEYGRPIEDDQDTPLEDVDRLADELLIDAMLKGRYQDTPQTTAERIEVAWRQQELLVKIHRRRWIAGMSAAAAIVLLGLGLISILLPSAQADLGPILAAFEQGDKTFQIDISSESEVTSEHRRLGRRRFGRGPSFKPPQRDMITRRLADAMLYTRGRNYVLTCRTPRGGKIAKGFDGQTSWQVLPWGRSMSVDTPDLMQDEIPDHIASLLFLDLWSMLHQIKGNYTLSGPSSGWINDGATQLDYYTADRIDGVDNVPGRIEFWFDVSSNQLQQITCTDVCFDRAHDKHYTLQIRLVNTDPLPENWFTPMAHR